MILSGRSPILVDKTMTVASSSSSLVCERLSVASSFILTAQLRNCVASKVHNLKSDYSYLCRWAHLKIGYTRSSTGLSSSPFEQNTLFKPVTPSKPRVMFSRSLLQSLMGAFTWRSGKHLSGTAMVF